MLSPFIGLLAAMMACTRGRSSPVEFLLQPNDVAVRQGEDAKFSCKVTLSRDVDADAQILVLWKHNGSYLDTSEPFLTVLESRTGSQTTAVLQIRKTNRMRDSGSYQCSLAFSVGITFANVDSRPARLTFIEDRPELRPEFQSVKSGRTAKLDCHLPQGLLSLEITWEKDGHELGSERRLRLTETNGVHSLRIRKIQATDSGSYVCVAGKRRSKEARVVIQDVSPSVTVSPPGTTTVKKGEMMTFRCTTGVSRPVEWLKGNTKLYSSPKISVSQSQLTIKAVSRSAEGNYTCKMVGRSQWATVSLRMAYIKRMRHGGSKHVEFVAGNAVHLSCDPPAGYPKPTVRWYFKGRLVTVGASLNIQDVTEKDNGQYTCSASNIAGVTNVTWNVKVVTKVTPSPSPTPTELDLFLLKPVDTNVVLFGALRWDCQIFYNPPFITYSWVHGKQKYTHRDEDASRIQVYPNGSLVISEIRRSDEGPWTCIADYNRVDVRPSNCSAVITVDDSEVPLHWIHGGKPPTRFNTGVTQTISLPCSAETSYPPLTLTWFKDNVIQQNISVPETIGSNKLTVLVTEESQSGTYRCVVQDQKDRLSAQTEVIVAAPPVVRVVPGSVQVYQGDEIRLMCEVMTGEGEVTLKWQVGEWSGLPESAGNRFTQHDNGTLVINQARTFDTSTYCCEASSSAGVGSASVNVTVIKLEEVEQLKETKSSTPVVAIVVVCVVVTILLLVVFGVWFYGKFAGSTEENPSVTQNTHSEALKVKTCNGGCDTTEIARSHLERGSTVGSGRYWTVYKAKLEKEWSKGSNDMAQSVLVKELHEEGFNRDRVMKEVMALKKLCHDNVAPVLGVSTDQQPHLVVIEDLDEGDLKRYLIKCRLSGSSLSFPRQCFILQQIISGLEYLASQGHVHKDLATRNCLVGKDMVVKISDLSLCVDGYEDDYVCETPAVTEQYRPIRWMSPEAVIKDEFTKENDIWSFGILMWEVVTMARQPYEGMSNSEVVSAIIKGLHQDKPSNCPSDLYEIMQSCWRKEPSKRPVAQSLSGLLHALSLIHA